MKGATYDTAGERQGARRSTSSGSRTATSATTTTRSTRTTPPAAFAKGKGVFYLGGNWQAQVIQAGLKRNVGFMNMPPGPSGKYVAIGATSLPWHISAKTKYPDVGGSVHQLADRGPEMAQLMYAQNQIPAILGAPAPPRATRT